MISIAGGDIAVLLEDCNDNPGTTAYDLIFQRLSIKTITNGRYITAQH